MKDLSSYDTLKRNNKLLIKKKLEYLLPTMLTMAALAVKAVRIFSVMYLLRGFYMIFMKYMQVTGLRVESPSSGMKNVLVASV